MAYSSYDTPVEFFGTDFIYDGSDTVSFNTADFAGTTVGTTFQGSTADNSLTTVASHGATVGDRVQVADGGGGLPAPLLAATDYYVKTVPSATKVTLAATPGGTEITLTTNGGATNTINIMGLLGELEDSEAEEASGDPRKIIYAFVEMFYQRYIAIPSASRPGKMSITRSSSTNETTGVVSRAYTFRFDTQAAGFEVVDE